MKNRLDVVWAETCEVRRFQEQTTVNMVVRKRLFAGFGITGHQTLDVSEFLAFATCVSWCPRASLLNEVRVRAWWVHALLPFLQVS